MIVVKPLPMAEALEYWRSKVQLTPKEFYALADVYKARAFTVSRLARADMLAEIHASLETALAEGTSFSAWKKSLSHVWEENGWTGVQAWRVDTIFRTNIQTAYNVGRYKQMMEVAADRPYWQYSAVNDSRTRPTHRALHGRVYRVDSPFWDTFYPPNGHRCRCKVKTLSARQVAQRGLEVREGNGLGELIEPIGPHGPEPARPLMPDKGFEGNPGKEAWEPDLSKYPDWLRTKLEAVLGRASAPSVPPIVGEAAPTMPVVPEFKTVKEANAWAVANNVADHADFSGVKPVVAKEWLQSMAEHMREFPELRANQKFTGTCQAQFARWWEIEVSREEAHLRASIPGWAGDFRKLAEGRVKKPKVEGGTFAHSWRQEDVRGIAVNKAWGSDPEKFRTAMAQDVANRFHPVGCDTFRSMADHEMGHQLDDLLGLRVDPNIMALYQEAKTLGMEREVSRYADTNIAEFVAECWAEARNNPAPRRFARWVESIVRSRYAAQYP